MPPSLPPYWYPELINILLSIITGPSDSIEPPFEGTLVNELKSIAVLNSQINSPVFLFKTYNHPSKPPPITKSFVAVSAAEIPISHAGFVFSGHLSIGVNLQLISPDIPSSEYIPGVAGPGNLLIKFGLLHIFLILSS